MKKYCTLFMVPFLLFATSAFADPIAIDPSSNLSFHDYIVAYLPALMLETITITFFVRKSLRKWPLFFLTWMVVTNVTWWGFNESLIAVSSFNRAAVLALAEAIIVVIEAYALHIILFSPRFVLASIRAPKWYVCLGISLIGNAVSFLAGEIIASLVT